MPTPTFTPRRKPSFVRRVASVFVPHDRGLRWETLAKVFTAAGVFLLPLVVTPWSNDVWELQKLSILFLTVVAGWTAFLIAMMKRGTDRWQWHPMDIIVLLFGLTISVATALSVNWWASLFGVSGWSSHSLLASWLFIGLYFLVTKLFSHAGDRQLLWTFFLISVAMSLLAQVFQMAGLSFLPEPLHANRWFGTLGNVNLGVTIIAATFGASLLVLWNSASERWMKLLISLGVVLSWMVLIFSGRALGWAVFALGMVFVVLHQSREERQVNMRLIMVAVALAALGLIAQLTNLASHSGLPALNELTLDSSTTFQTALTTIQERPVLGTGPSTWYEAFIDNRPLSFNQNPVWDIRFFQGGSAWLQLMTTTGIAGALLLLGLLCLGLAMTWRAWRRSGDAFLLITAFVLLVTIVSGFFTIWSFVWLMIVWVALGLARATVTDHARLRSTPVPGWGYGAAAIGAVLLVVALIPLVSIYASDVVAYRAAQKAAKVEPLNTVTAMLERAHRLNRHNPEAMKLLMTAYASQILNAADNQKTNEAAAALKKLNALVLEAQGVFGDDPQLYEAHNQVLNALSSVLPDAVVQAKSNFTKLRQIEPVNPIHDVGFGQTVMTEATQQNQSTPTSGDSSIKAAVDQALAAYAMALSKKPDYFQAQLSTMQALIEGGRPQEGLTVFKDINVLSPVERSYVRLIRAQGLDALKKPAEAADEVMNIITEFPNDPGLYTTAADYLIKANKKTEAKNILEQGQELFPSDQAIKDKLSSL